MRDVEVGLFGGEEKIVQPDALDGFDGSVEQGVVCIARTKRYIPFGPAGEGVAKRMFVQVQHSGGMRFEVTPRADGQKQHELLRIFGRAPFPSPDPERFSFLVPLAKFHNARAYSTGLRATSFGLDIEVFMPSVSFHIESFTLEALPLAKARGLKTTDVQS
jgi:hypothetical protein